MKISQEAREAAIQYCGFESEDDLAYWGSAPHREKVSYLATAMQKLINQTIERAAGVADERAESYAKWPAANLLNGARHGEAMRIATAIRAMKEG